MIGYWAFNEGKGDVTKNTVCGSPDIFGNSGDARIEQPAWMAGRYGKAIDFSGSKTAVLVDKTTELECEKEVSIAAWVKLKEPRGRGLVVNHSYAYRLFVTQGGRNRVGFQLNLNGEWASNWLIGRTSLENGKWYHIAGVYDGKERRIYINGKLDAVEPAGGTIGNGRDFVIGAESIKTEKRVFRANGKVKYKVAEPFGGVIDEVKVWNRALSHEEIAKAAKENQAQVASLLGDHRDLYFYAVKSVGMLGEVGPYQLAVFNGAAKPFSGDVVVTVSAPEGETVYEKTNRLNILSRESRTISIPIKAAQAGVHRARVASHGDEIFETSLIALAPQARQAVGKLDLKKVLSVDLTKALGPDEFLDDGTSRIVDSSIGAYREAGAKKFSRFVARLPLRRTGLHLVRVTYPDDKVRTCEIATRSPVAADGFNAHSGYFTGGDFPISGKLQTFEFIMWARDVNQALVFTTWLDNQPAAASAIEVFEIDGRLPAGEASRAPSFRHIGHFWEDAQPLSRSFGGNAADLEDFDATVGNMCDYFDYTGQNLLMHPVVWYEGPIYNSLVEGRGGQGGFHFPTAGWVDILLKRFEERGFKFYALFNVHQLPSLMNTMNVDTAKIQAGEPTFNAISRDNETRIKRGHHRSSMFNALHPRVQERILALVEEVGDRYAGSPAFAGIGFHLTMAQLLQPGGLEVSYDDWTMGEFKKDTGMKIPVDGSDPERFGKRYEWIMENAQDEWIQWRCERIAEYYGKVAEILRDKRKDLQLVVTILEPPMSMIDPQRQAWMDGKRLVELSREGGIDPALLGKHPGVVIQQRLGPTAKKHRLTSGVTRGRWGSP
ncbi:MAG: hypothetical protein QNL26_10815, partial [Acidimicrobiia bacterium]|nr:hypothetical protein [Acidimicrobiia bacterium]